MSPGRSVGAEHLLNIGAEPFVVDWSSMTKGAEPIWKSGDRVSIDRLRPTEGTKGPAAEEIEAVTTFGAFRVGGEKQMTAIKRRCKWQ